MPSPSPLDPSSPDPRARGLERRIQEKIRAFDVTALLDLLLSMGYETSEIAFRGHLTASPQPTVIHDIEFRGEPERRPPPEPGQEPEISLLREPVAPDVRVTVTVNLGLLSCRSPLPSYFQQLFVDMEATDPVIELLRTLDRPLLRTRLTSDTADRMLDTWEDVRRDFVRIHGLDSPMGLHWLFHHVFPELGVAVRRITDEYRVPYNSARLGLSDLGYCSFGSVSRLTVHDLEVGLVAEDACYGEDPWLRVADRRIRRFILPWLDEVCMNLTVSFVLLDRSSFARIARNSYVGYDPMWDLLDGDPDDQLPPTRVVLFRGALPQLEPDADDLEQVMATGQSDTLELGRPPPDPPDAAPRVPEPTGHQHRMAMTFTDPEHERVYAYEVRVYWGCRSWYAEEPAAMELDFQGMPKADITARHHPNLWLWLRDEARVQVANRMAIEMMAVEPEERVTETLIEGLIERNDEERLNALLLSRLQWSPSEPSDVDGALQADGAPEPEGPRAPPWSPQAWQRFPEWSDT